MNDYYKKEELETLEITIDPLGTLYFVNGRVLRAIYHDYEDQVLDIMNGGLMDELLTNNLFVKTWISTASIEGYNLVLEHENIELWNYPYEWTFSMLKDAGNTVLSCNEIANKYDYELYDVHAFNVVFKMTQPLYVDFGSFIKKDARNGRAWSGFNIFYNTFYMPLYLYSKGFSDIPNSTYLFNGILSDKDLFLLRYKYSTLFGTWLSDVFFKIHSNKRRLGAARYTRVLDKYGKHPRINQILKVKKVIQNSYSTKRAKGLTNSISKSRADSYWKNYHDNKNPSSDKRFIRITEIINQLMKDADSMVELASNQGKFASHVHQNTHLSNITATDYDKNALDQLYHNYKGKQGMSTIVYDFVRPNNRSNTIDVSKRIKGDIAMALAVTHHLILTQDVSLDHILNTLNHIASKYVIIEFMPLGLYSGDMNNIPPVPDYYTLDWFKAKFSEKFNYLLDEEVATNRHLFVGRVK
jgi:hypothetical protein